MKLYNQIKLYLDTCFTIDLLITKSMRIQLESSEKLHIQNEIRINPLIL